MQKKYIYNYNLEQCNALLKKGIYPIGVNTNNTTGNVFFVYAPRKKYFDTLREIYGTDFDLKKAEV